MTGRKLRAFSLIGAIVAISARPAAAQPQPSDASAPTEEAPPPAEPAAIPPSRPAEVPATTSASPIVVAQPSIPGLHNVEIHGFVSEGGFWSTANEYIGTSSRGSLQLFEAGINFSTEVVDRLRAGMQIFARDFGALEDPPRVDWAFLDYRWRTWLGIRAGVIKMPFGLYNEYTDVDSARLPILMPQSIYSFVNRDVLLSHRGFAVYGDQELHAGGSLEYQVWLGTLSIPQNALTLNGGTIDSVNTRYVTGAQLFWHPPVEGLRIGATYLRASIDFNITLSEANTAALIMAGVVPPDYTGTLVISQRPDTWVVGSAEYTRGGWLLAAEYSRAFKHQQTTLPAAIPTFDEDSERFYGMASYRASSALEAGAYYSVYNLDANDRGGHDPKYAEHYYAFQRDLAATLRFDVNDHWLWKLEGHFMDGTADLPAASNPSPSRYWGLVLLRTTVTF